MKTILQLKTLPLVVAAPPAPRNRTIPVKFSADSRLAFGTPSADKIAAEEYRIIARRLRTRFPQGAVIAITSPGEGEGKTLTAANLALAFGEDSQSTLLVDLDLRCPSLGERLSAPVDTTINKVLAGMATPREAILELAERNVDVCVAEVEPDPAKLVCSDLLRPLLQELRATYTYVVLDTPPVLPAGDILDISLVSDAVLLVVRENHTCREMLRRATERLSGTLCGVILNDSADNATAGYGKRYHQGH